MGYTEYKFGEVINTTPNNANAINYNEDNTVSDKIEEIDNSISTINNTLSNKADSSTVSNLSSTVSGHTTSISNINTTIGNMGKSVSTLLSKTANGTYAISGASNYRYLVVVLKWNIYYYATTVIPVSLISALGGFNGMALTDTSGKRALYRINNAATSVVVAEIPSDMTFFIYGIK